MDDGVSSDMVVVDCLAYRAASEMRTIDMVLSLRSSRALWDRFWPRERISGSDGGSIKERLVADRGRDFAA